LPYKAFGFLLEGISPLKDQGNPFGKPAQASRRELELTGMFTEKNLRKGKKSLLASPKLTLSRCASKKSQSRITKEVAKRFQPVNQAAFLAFPHPQMRFFLPSTPNRARYQK